MSAPVEEVFVNPLYPDLSITLALFRDVKNIPQLKQMAVSGGIEAALIKPTMILDSWQILMAANQAVHLHQTESKKTRQLHSEIIYSLAASRNISDSFKRFGISDEDTCLLVVAVHSTDQGVRDILDKVEGTQVNLSDLASMSDVDTIKKVYKIKDGELMTGTLLDAVVNRIASKSFISF